MTFEDVKAAVIAMSTDGFAPSGEEWNRSRPDGYPTRQTINTRWKMGWGAVIEACGLQPAPKYNYVRDVEHYRQRVIELSAKRSDGLGITVREWNAARGDNEYSGDGIHDVFKLTWNQLIRSCELKPRKDPEAVRPPKKEGFTYVSDSEKPPHTKARLKTVEDREAEIFAAEQFNVRPRGVQSLRLVASDTPRGVRRLYCWRAQGYYEVKVHGGGRFE